MSVEFHTSSEAAAYHATFDAVPTNEAAQSFAALCESAMDCCNATRLAADTALERMKAHPVTFAQLLLDACINSRHQAPQVPMIAGILLKNLARVPSLAASMSQADMEALIVRVVNSALSASDTRHVGKALAYAAGAMTARACEAVGVRIATGMVDAVAATLASGSQHGVAVLIDMCDAWLSESARPAARAAATEIAPALGDIVLHAVLALCRHSDDAAAARVLSSACEVIDAAVRSLCPHAVLHATVQRVVAQSWQLLALDIAGTPDEVIQSWLEYVDLLHTCVTHVPTAVDPSVSAVLEDALARLPGPCDDEEVPAATSATLWLITAIVRTGRWRSEVARTPLCDPHRLVEALVRPLLAVPADRDNDDSHCVADLCDVSDATRSQNHRPAVTRLTAAVAATDEQVMLALGQGLTAAADDVGLLARLATAAVHAVRAHPQHVASFKELLQLLLQPAALPYLAQQAQRSSSGDALGDAWGPTCDVLCLVAACGTAELLPPDVALHAVPVLSALLCGTVSTGTDMSVGMYAAAALRACVLSAAAVDAGAVFTQNLEQQRALQAAMVSLGPLATCDDLSESRSVATRCIAALVSAAPAAAAPAAVALVEALAAALDTGGLSGTIAGVVRAFPQHLDAFEAPIYAAARQFLRMPAFDDGRGSELVGFLVDQREGGAIPACVVADLQASEIEKVDGNGVRSYVRLLHALCSRNVDQLRAAGLLPRLVGLAVALLSHRKDREVACGTELVVALVLALPTAEVASLLQQVLPSVVSVARAGRCRAEAATALCLAIQRHGALPFVRGVDAGKGDGSACSVITDVLLGGVELVADREARCVCAAALERLCSENDAVRMDELLWMRCLGAAVACLRPSDAAADADDAAADDDCPRDEDETLLPDPITDAVAAASADVGPPDALTARLQSLRL